MLDLVKHLKKGSTWYGLPYTCSDLEYLNTLQWDFFATIVGPFNPKVYKYSLFSIPLTL